MLKLDKRHQQAFAIGATGLATSTVASTAKAESVVPAASTTKLSTDGTDTITAVGGAMIGLAVVAVLFKWAKASIFG